MPVLRLTLAGLLCLLLASSLRAQEVHDRQFLDEAIEAVRALGYEITWSDALVKPWMRVRETPEQPEPIEALRDALEPYGLTLERLRDGGWLVVEGELPAVMVAPDTSAPEAEPPRAEPILPLEQVVIVASRYTLYEGLSTTDQFMSGEEIRLMPHLADDSFRAFHRLPGVAANDFSAAFNLRGGAVEEVKVVLDGLELFDPYHMRTLFNPLSIVDPGIIGSAQLLSGGFTADYGNHMSGVLDITSEQPAGLPVHEVGASFVSAFARSSGAWGDSSSYLVSLRRGYLDLIADAVTGEGEELSPRYSDLFAKFSRDVSDRSTLSAQVLLAGDDTQFTDDEDGEDFGGDSQLGYAWLSLETEPNDQLLWRNMVFGGHVETSEEGSLTNLPFEFVYRSYNRDVSIYGLKSDLSWSLSDRQVWMFGARYRDLSADYDYFVDSTRQTDIWNNGVPYVVRRDLETRTDGHELGLYARYRFQPTDRATIEFGLRWDTQSYTDTHTEDDGDDQLSPRVNAVYRLGERSDLRAGWGYYYQPQGIHELQIEDGVTSFFPAERAEHRVVGVSHFFDSGLELQADVFHKKYSDLRPRFENVFDTYEFAPETNFDRVLVAPEKAEAHGVELTLRAYEGDQLDWWINYTWSKAEDTIEGVDVPRSWDQRHAVTANLVWRGEKWRFSAVGRYHSGWPRTPLLPTPVLDPGGGLDFIGSDFSQRNKETYDDYFRVDVRLTRTVQLPRSTLEWYIEVLNVFDYNNECCIPDFNVDFGSGVSVRPNIDDYLPIFPSFGLTWRFGPGS
ncbi:MAG: TonB-dependent receptor [Xanthomonadales bacterium]|nr:TonB-dependent receptor [Xanthomonadales bacterium]